MNEIERENKNRKENLMVLERYSKMDKVPIQEFLSLKEVEQQLIIYEIIVNKVDNLVNHLSWYRIIELIKLLHSNKPNVCIKIYGSYYFIREYNYFYVDIIEDKVEFSYVMKQPGILDTKEFSCDFTCDTSQLKITDDSYPLTFRNVNEDDKVICIAFAGVFDNEGNFISLYSLKVNKINEFLNKYI